MAQIYYWQKRIFNEQHKMYNHTYLNMMKDLKKSYYKANKNIQYEISNLYDKLLADSLDNTVHVNDFYKLNRNFELMARINKELKVLGGNELNIDNKAIIKLYNLSQKVITKYLPKHNRVNQSFTLYNKNTIEELIKMSWASDDMTLSKRIWKNKSRIQQKIEDGLQDCIIRGVPKDKVVENIMNTMGTSFNDSDRIVRTELSHYQNKGSIDKYIDEGVREVKTIVAHDNRLCPICKTHDGEIYNINEAIDGIAYNFHPNCRCAIVPIIK